MVTLSSKKITAVALFALIIALFSFVYSSSLELNESIFQIEVNNTNLAPTVPGETVGTGERVQGVTYYANDTPIELFVWGHAQTTGDTAEIHLFINGTKIADTSGRPLGVAEQSNKTITAMIPKYASYMIETNNMHHYEWREYRILSGQNGSVNITYINNSLINQTALDGKVNKSGDTMTGKLRISSGGLEVNTSASTNLRYNVLVDGKTSYVSQYAQSVDADNNGIRFSYDVIPVLNNKTAEIMMFRQTNTTGSVSFKIMVGNNTANANSQLSANGNSYFNALLGGVSIGKTSLSTGYKLDIEDSVRVAANITIVGQSGTGTRAACFLANGTLVASTNSTYNYATC